MPSGTNSDFNMPILNRTITTGGVAQDILANGHGWGGFIINCLDEDAWLSFGSDAAVDNGEKLYQDSPAKYSYTEFPELGARVSIFSATTGAKFTIRPIG